MQRSPLHSEISSPMDEIGSRRGHGMRQQTRIGLSLLMALVFAVAAFSQVSVTTYHYDNARTGLNPNETLLTTTSVNFNSFEKLFSYNVDGFVVAQPLYVPNVIIPGQGTHNVVYVVTQHDSVFAFDADSVGSGAPLWQASFINPP